MTERAEELAQNEAKMEKKKTHRNAKRRKWPEKYDLKLRKDRKSVV